MLKKQPSQLAFPYAEAFRKLFYACAVAVKRSFPDECQARDTVFDVPRHEASSGAVSGRQLRQGKLKARVLRGRCRTVKMAIRKLRSAGRTHGAAVDPRKLPF